jgi:hypothetical protein
MIYVIIALGTAIVALVLALVNLLMIVRNVRGARELSKAVALAQQYENILCELCVQAFELQSEPIWRAWATTMGEIEVDVKSKQKTYNIKVG